MDTKDFTGLLSILKFALPLCGALIIMGNMGMFSSMPIMMKNPLTSQIHVDYIHILYYLAFNGLFVGFFICLWISFQHTKTKTRSYLQHH
ncbi:hypothetical protein [Photobacterium leiognathi]|uniref:hypothetical protein n=1 Tax=Photobacterium leiognathi TaxID=553611 RepID=UPI00298272EF|nr:hypothetical protein [Photobacterium leiognathi]